MSTCVCVLGNNGERLMPTIRLGKVRRLLMDFGNAFATTDVFVNPRKGIPFVQCSTENQLSDFRRADSHE